MNDTLNTLLQSAAGKVEEKKQSILQEQPQKTNSILPNPNRYDFSGQTLTTQTGLGTDSQTEFDVDMRYLSSPELRQKYGPGIDTFIAEQRRAGSQLADLNSSSRDRLQGIGDSSLDLAAGVGNTILGAAALSGVVSPTAGRAVAGASEWFNDAIQDSQSDFLSDRRELGQATMALRSRDNRANSDSDFERVAKDALSSIQNYEGTTFSSDLFQGLGSLVGGAGVGKGAAMAGSRATNLTSRKATAELVGDADTVRRLEKLGERIQDTAMVGTIGASEAGGVYSDITNKILGMSHEELMAGSAYYRKVFEMHGSEERAKEETAQAAARKGALTMLPVALAAAPLVSRFEANPVQGSITGSWAASARNTLAQTAEESLQGGAAEYIAGTNIQNYADESVDPLKSVGEGIGRGAATGMGMTAATQAPALVASTVYSGAKLAGEKLASRIDKVNKEIENASPVSTDKLAPLSTNVQDNLEGIQTTLSSAIAEMPTEQQGKANEFAERLVSLGSHTEGQFGHPFLDAVTEGSSNKLEALQRIGQVLEDPRAPEQVKTAAALGLLQSYDGILSIAQSDALAYEALADDSPAAQTVNSLVGVIQQYVSNPEVASAVEAAMQILQDSTPEIAPIEPETINTPESQQNINTAIQLAQVAPEKGNLETNEQILYHAERGDIQLTSEQQSALVISNALIRAERNAQSRGSQLQLSADAMRVNKEVTLESDEKGKSIADHAKGIYLSLLNGNEEAATQQLTELGNFAQTMSNKLAALNANITAGVGSPKQTYQAWNPVKQVWFESNPKKGLFYNPKSQESIDQSKAIFHEARLAVDVYNNMVDAVGIGNKIPVVPAPTFEATAAPTATVVETPALTPEQAKKLSDEALANRVQELRDIPQNQRTQQHRETAKVLRDESRARKENMENAAKTVRENLKSSPEIKAGVPTPIAEEVVKEEPVPEVVTEPEQVTGPVQATESVPELKGIAAAFPDLMGVTEGRNVFVSSFKFPAEQRTRFMGEESPLQAIKDILSNSLDITSLIGSQWASRIDDRVTRSWKSYLDFGSSLSQSVANRFDKEINKEKVTKERGTGKSKKNPSLLQQWNQGKPVHKYTTGLLFNIAQPFTTKSGRETAVLNPQLLQSASLATLHWLLNPQDSPISYDQQDAVKVYQGIMGNGVTSVSEEALELLNTGTTVEESIRSLAGKINSYWGLQEDANGFVGNQQGITESMARMFLEDLVNKGVLSETDQVLTLVDGQVRPAQESDGDAPKIRIKKWAIDPEVTQELNEELQGTKSLIEELMVLEPELITYVGEDKVPPPSRHQLRQSLAPLTKQQQKVQERANNQIYNLDPDMVSIFGLFGKDQLVEAFGGQDTTNDKLFNKNNLISVNGQRKAISAAYDALESLIQEINSVAEAEGKSPAEVTVRYKHEFASVNRLFMQGAYSPQSSKLMREAMLTTWKTVDLTDSQMNDMFHLALAQGLDISIHKQPHETSIEQVKSLLEGPLAPAVEQAKKLLDKMDTNKLLDQSNRVMIAEVKALFEDAKVPFNFLALKTVVEYAKSQQAEDPTQFRSSAYIEADGMTNGPANAMMLFSDALPTTEWVRNMERVGLYINQPDATANEKNVGTQDLYQTGADNFIRIMQDFLQTRDEPWKAESARNLHSIISMFDKDFNFRDGEDLAVKRGFFKNPLMVMIYGSSEHGVAGAITSNFLDEVYKRMTSALQAQYRDPSLTTAQAMFPDSANPEQDWKLFQSRLGQAAGLKGLSIHDLSTFTISGPAYKKLRASIQQNIVSVMYQAVRETVGEDVFRNVENMAAAVNAMSVYAARLQKNLIEAQTEIYKQTEEGFTSRELLRKKDLAEIEKKIRSVSAYIEATHQNFFIAGQNKFEVARHTSEGMSGLNPIKGTIQGFGGAGVSGVAYMNQGSGDAQMVQFGYANGGQEMDKVMPAFDGMHFPFGDMQAGGLTMNTAVADSWKLNPLKNVSETFENFLKEADLSILTEEDLESIFKMVKTESPEYLSETIGIAETESLEDLSAILKETAEKIGAKQKIITEVSHVIDQMAGTGATYKNSGIELQSTTPEDIASELTDLMLLAKQNEAAPLTFRDLFTKPDSKPSSVQVIKPNALSKLMAGNLLNQDQKNVLGDLNLGSLSDWRIFIGDQQALIEFAKQRGMGSQQLTEALNSGKGGFTLPTEKHIFVLNGSAETALHEVIHAATYEKVVAHVEGTATNDAVTRIQGMMDDFMQLTPDDYGHLVSTAMQAVNLQNVIQEARANGQEAVAINEFMAWTLSNKNLTDFAKTRKIPKVLQIAKDAWNALKEVIFGKKRAPAVGSDMYSNLRFNTAVLANTQLDVSELVNSGPALFHDTSKIDPELEKLDQAMKTLIRNSVSVANVSNISNESQLGRALKNTQELVNEISNAFFNMTAEEVETFKSISMALSVEQSLDRNTLREANTLFKETVKQLKVEDFIPEGADDTERAYANAKYALITGSSYTGTDRYGRSTVLPTFIALALTSREFKDILGRMKKSDRTKSDETGLDGVLENFGYKSLDSLNAKLTGTGNAQNIQEAMNILGNQIIEQQQERENRFETPGRFVDTVNDWVVTQTNALAHKLTPQLTDEQKAQRTKWEKGLAGFKAGLAALIDEDLGTQIAEDSMAKLDSKKIPNWFLELSSDLVGRVPGNAMIYDMIKQVRSTVQAIRQNYRVKLPTHIKKQFSNNLSEQDWGTLQRGILKTDLSNLSLLGSSKADIRLWASNETARQDKISQLEAELATSGNSPEWVNKAKQLAHFMNTGESGINLQRNAEAIVDLLGTSYSPDIPTGKKREDYVKSVDALVSLYAIEGMNQVDKDNLATLIKDNETGVDYVLSYVGDMLKDEHSKITADAKYNVVKGFIPFEQKPNVSLIVGHDSQHSDLIRKGYVRVDDFTGANAELSRGLGYYRMAASAQAAFNQGIAQTARSTVMGVDPNLGFAAQGVVKRITDPTVIKRALRKQDPANPLIPVFNMNGSIIALEQMMEPRMRETVADEQDIAQTIGKWKGRQQEELLSQAINESLVTRLHDMYKNDPNKDRYVNVFESKDPVIMDAVNNLPESMRRMIREKFDTDGLMVQKHLLRDVLGYREASVRDMWSGQVRLPAATQKAVVNMATLVMGKDAYKNMVRAEEILENLVSNAKLIIAVKSGIIPAINIISNLLHLVSRGVPVKQMTKQVPTKLAEIKEFTESRLEYMRLEADYAAATQPNQRTSIAAQMEAILDGHKRLSIWPLIEAGEFTAISDVDLRDADRRLTSGKWAEYIDNAVAKLPDGVNTAGRYLMVSKDTALFNALQKSVEYGDLVAKAVLYDDLVTRGGKTKEEALGIITEEFVNYDRLPGRTRGKLEKMGLLWFYNFKLRSVKVALSTIRNNPVHTLFALALPSDYGIGSAGIPIQDNAVTMGLMDRLGGSIGPDQGLRAPSLLPINNLLQ